MSQFQLKQWILKAPPPRAHATVITINLHLKKRVPHTVECPSKVVIFICHPSHMPPIKEGGGAPWAIINVLCSHPRQFGQKPESWWPPTGVKLIGKRLINKCNNTNKEPLVPFWVCTVGFFCGFFHNYKTCSKFTLDGSNNRVELTWILHNFRRLKRTLELISTRECAPPDNRDCKPPRTWQNEVISILILYDINNNNIIEWGSEYTNTPAPLRGASVVTKTTHSIFNRNNQLSAILICHNPAGMIW